MARRHSRAWHLKHDEALAEQANKRRTMDAAPLDALVQPPAPPAAPEAEQGDAQYQATGAR